MVVRPQTVCSQCLNGPFVCYALSVYRYLNKCITVAGDIMLVSIRPTSAILFWSLSCFVPSSIVVSSTLRKVSELSQHGSEHTPTIKASRRESCSFYFVLYSHRWNQLLENSVQHECIPQAVLGMDIICQAKSGMGKTAVFVLATLHQLQPVQGEIHVVVLCHTRELAYQIQREYERFSKYLPDIKSRVFYGGAFIFSFIYFLCQCSGTTNSPVPMHAVFVNPYMSLSSTPSLLKQSTPPRLWSACVCIYAGVNIRTAIETLENDKPHIVVGTPGRILDLVNRKAMDLSHVKHFVLDECDRLLAEIDMRRDVQNIFKATPHEKQVMMYSATLDKEVRPVCRKFCQDVSFIFLRRDVLLIRLCWCLGVWDLCRRRYQAHPARPSAVLHSPRGEGKEQETQWLVGCTWIQPG
jgi:hypothetical protein